MTACWIFRGGRRRISRNTWRQTEAFTDGKPWLLRFFDQIRFYPVSADELLQIRRDFPLGRYELHIEDSELALADYQDFLAAEAEGIDAFRSQHGNATTIIIAQRITSVMEADRIVVLQDGKIDGVGTHAELLEQNEIYREVYSSQQKGVA